MQQYNPIHTTVCMARKPLGIFHFDNIQTLILTYSFKLRGIDTNYLCEQPKLASLKQIPVFCARFLVDPAPQFSNILIKILRDILHLHMCDMQPTLPNLITKPASPMPPEAP